IPSADKSFDERTSLLDTGTSTNSLVISGSGAEIAEGVSGRDAHSGKDVEESQSEKSDSSMITTTHKSDSSIKLRSSTENSLPPLPKPTEPRNQLPGIAVLDDTALAAEMAKKPVPQPKAQQPMALETEEVSSPSINRNTRSGTNRYQRTDYTSRRKKAKP